jgi:hypothetical protein
VPCFCGLCGGFCGVLVSLIQSMPLSGFWMPILGMVYKRRHLDTNVDGCTHEGVK